MCLHVSVCLSVCVVCVLIALCIAAEWDDVSCVEDFAEKLQSLLQRRNTTSDTDVTLAEDNQCFSRTDAGNSHTSARQSTLKVIL